MFRLPSLSTLASNHQILNLSELIDMPEFLGGPFGTFISCDPPPNLISIGGTSIQKTN